MPPDTMHRKEHSIISGDLFLPQIHKCELIIMKLNRRPNWGHSTKLLISSLKTERL